MRDKLIKVIELSCLGDMAIGTRWSPRGARHGPNNKVHDHSFSPIQSMFWKVYFGFAQMKNIFFLNNNKYLVHQFIRPTQQFPHGRIDY